MNELALFAGAGGGILGGLLHGWRTVAAVEIEDYPRRVLLQRQADGILPKFPIWDDVRTFVGRPWRGKVDIITGGFPCQDISVAGKGAGIEGERSGLWAEMARIISEVLPQFVFVENSPAITFRGGVRVIADLAQMGYVGRYGIMGGSCVGNVAEGERFWVFATTANCPMLEGLDVHTFIKPCTKESCRRQFTRAVGAMLQPDDYARIKRDTNVVANGMDRLKAIGNGQIPAVAALAWSVLRNQTQTEDK